MSASTDGARPRTSPFGVVAAAAGLALFIWSLTQAGLPTIADGISRVGGGFLLILFLAGARFWVRSVAWSLATETPAHLKATEAFPALVAGDALGNLTPLGLFLSETTKAAYIRPRLSLMAAVAGIAIENLVYTLTVALVMAVGTMALLLAFEPTPTIQQIAVGALVAIGIGSGMVVVMLTRQVRVFTTALQWLNRRRLLPGSVAPHLARLATLEDQVCGFATRHPRGMYSILLLELSFHALGVLEVWITLALLLPSSAPTLLNTFVLESVNRTVMVVFKFVPLRLGVDEVGTELLTRTIGFPLGIGVTMAVIRKARMIVWSAIGVAFLLRRGLHPATLAN